MLFGVLVFYWPFCLSLIAEVFFLLLPFSCKVCLQKTGVLH